MINFNKNQFLNNIANHLNKLGHKQPSSEFKYNLPKGLTSYFLIMSTKNTKANFIELLSKSQNYVKKNPNTESSFHSYLGGSISGIIDIQSPLDNNKRYQEYALHSCKLKNKKSILNEKSLFEYHMFKEEKNINKSFKKTNDIDNYSNHYNYNKEVHELAYQYLSNFKNIKCGNELIQNTTLNKIFLSKLLADFPNFSSKPDIKLMRSCLDIASKHMGYEQLKTYDEKMQKQGLLNAHQDEYKNSFKIDTMTEFKTKLRKDISLSKVDNKEIAVQLFAKKDSVAAYISQSSFILTPDHPPISITTFEIFNTKKGTEKFYNVDEFLTALTKEVVHYNKKHHLPISEVKYKKYYKLASPVTDLRQVAPAPIMQTPSAPPLPQQNQAANSGAPPSYEELFSNASGIPLFER